MATISADRADKHETLGLLIREGADRNQRGINDGTPLHHAVGRRDLESLRLLLEAGADSSLRAHIDDFETPWELAVRGFEEGARLLSARKNEQQ